MDASVRFAPPQGLRVTDSQLDALLPSGVCPDSGVATLDPVNPVAIQGTPNLEADADLSRENAQIVLSWLLGANREVADYNIDPFIRIVNSIVNGDRESTRLSCLTVAELRQNTELRELVRFAFEDSISGRPLDPQALAPAEDGPDQRQDLAALAASNGELDSPITRNIRSGALQMRVDITRDTNGVLDGYRVFLRYYNHEEQVAEYHRGQDQESQRPASALAREAISYWQRVLRGNRYLDANSFTEGVIDEDTINAYQTYSLENNLMINFYDPDDILALIAERQREFNELYARILARSNNRGWLNTASTEDLTQRHLYCQMVEDALNRLTTLIGLARQYEDLARRQAGQDGLSAADRRLGEACQTIVREYSGIAEALLSHIFLGADPLISLDRLSLQETREASFRGNIRHEADKRGQYLGQLVQMISNLTRWRAMAQAYPEAFAAVRAELDVRLAELRGEVEGLPARESRWVRQELSYIDTEVMRAIEAERTYEAPNNQVLYARYRRTRAISDRIGSDPARGTMVGMVSGFLREADLDRVNPENGPTDSLGFLDHVARLFVGEVNVTTGRSRGGLIGQDGDDMLASCRLNYSNGIRESVGLARDRGGDNVADFSIDSLERLSDTDKRRVQRFMGQLYGYIAQNEPELLNDVNAMLARFREILETIIFVIGVLREIPTNEDGTLNANEMRMTLSPLNGTCNHGEQATYELGQQLDQSSHALLQQDFPGLSAGSSMVFTPRALRQLEVRMVDNFSTGGTIPYSDIEEMREARPLLRPHLENLPDGGRFFISDLGIVAVPATLEAVPDATANRGPQFGVVETRDPVSFARELPVAFLNLIVALQPIRGRSGRITDEDQLREFGRTPGQITANNLRLYLEVFGASDLWVVNPNSLALSQPERDVLIAIDRILEANPQVFGNLSAETIALLARIRSSNSEITFTPQERDQLWALLANLRIWNGTVGRSNVRNLAGQAISESRQRELLTFLKRHGYLGELNESILELPTQERSTEAEAAFVADLAGLTWLNNEQRAEIYQTLLSAARERTDGTLFTTLEQEADRNQGQRTDLTTALDRLEYATSRMTIKLGLGESERTELGQLASYLSWADDLPANDPLRIALTIWDTRLARETPSTEMLEALRTLAARNGESFTEQNEANFLQLYANCIQILRRMGNQAFAMSFRTPEDETRWEGWGATGLGFYRHMANAATQTLEAQRRTDFRASGLPSEQIFYINMILRPELTRELEEINVELNGLNDIVAGIAEERIRSNNPIARQVRACKALVDRGSRRSGHERPPGRVMQIMLEINERHRANPLSEDSRFRSPLMSFQGLVQDSLVRMAERPDQFVTEANGLLHQVSMQRDAVRRELAVLDEREANRNLNPAAANVPRGLNPAEEREYTSLLQMAEALDLLTAELSEMVAVSEREIPSFRRKSALERQRNDLVAELQDPRFDAEDFALLLERFPDLADTSFAGRRLPTALASIATNDFERFDDVNRRYTGRFPIEILQEYFRQNPAGVLSFETLSVVIGQPENQSNAVLALQQLCQMIPTQRQYIDVTRVAPTLLPITWQARFPGGSHGMFVPVRDLTAMFGTFFLGQRSEIAIGPQTLGELRNYSSNWYRTWFSYLSFLSMASAERGRMPITSQVYMAIAADPEGQRLLAQILGESANTGDLPLNTVNRQIMERFFNFYMERFRNDLLDPNSDLSQMVTDLNNHDEIALSREELLEMLSQEGIRDLMAVLPNSDTFEIFDSRHETGDRATMQRVSRFIEAVLMLQGRMNEVSPGRNPMLYAVSQADPRTDARRADVYSVLDPLAHRFNEVTAIVHNSSLVAETARGALGEGAGGLVERGWTWLTGSNEARRDSIEVELPGVDLRDHRINTDFSPNLEIGFTDASFALYRLAQNLGRDGAQETIEAEEAGVLGTAGRTGRAVEDGAMQWTALTLNFKYLMQRMIALGFVDFWTSGVAEGTLAYAAGDDHNLHHAVQETSRRGGHVGGSFSLFNMFKQAFYTDPLSDFFSGNYSGAVGKTIAIWRLTRTQGSNAYLRDVFNYALQRTRTGWELLRATGSRSASARNLALSNARNFSYEAAQAADRLYFRDALRVQVRPGQFVTTHAHEHFARDTGVKLVRNVVIRPVRFVGNLTLRPLTAAGDALSFAARDPQAAAQAIKTVAERATQAMRNPGATVRAAGRVVANRASAAETSVVDWVTTGARNAWWKVTGNALRPGVVRTPAPAGWVGRALDWVIPDTRAILVQGNRIPRSLYERATSRLATAFSGSSAGTWLAGRLGAQNLSELSSVVAAEGQAVGRSGINWLHGAGSLVEGIVIATGGAELGEDLTPYVAWAFDLSENSNTYRWASLGTGLAGSFFALGTKAGAWPLWVTRGLDQLLFTSFWDGYDVDLRERSATESLNEAATSNSTLEFVVGSLHAGAEPIAPNLSHLLWGGGDDARVIANHDATLIIPHMQAREIEYLRQAWLEDGLLSYNGSVAPDREFFRSPYLADSFRSSALARLSFNNHTRDGQEVFEADAYEYVRVILQDSADLTAESHASRFAENQLLIYERGFQLTDLQRRTLTNQYHIQDVDAFVERAQMRHMMGRLALLNPARQSDSIRDNNEAFRRNFDEYREDTAWEWFTGLFGPSSTVEENATNIMSLVIDQSRAANLANSRTNFDLTRSLTSLVSLHRQYQRIEALRAGTTPTALDRELSFVNEDGAINEYWAHDVASRFSALAERLHEELPEIVTDQILASAREAGSQPDRRPAFH